MSSVFLSPLNTLPGGRAGDWQTGIHRMSHLTYLIFKNILHGCLFFFFCIYMAWVTNILTLWDHSKRSIYITLPQDSLSSILLFCSLEEPVDIYPDLRAHLLSLDLLFSGLGHTGYLTRVLILETGSGSKNAAWREMASICKLTPWWRWRSCRIKWYFVFCFFKSMLAK